MPDKRAWNVSLAPRALHDFKQLDRPVAQRIARKLKWLADQAETTSHTGLMGEWAGLFRLRVGAYRVIYSLDHEERLILVATIGHRRDIYLDAT